MSVDWWSLGILIFEMINGLPPFYDTNRKMMYRRILTAPVQKTVYMTPEVGMRGEVQQRRTTLCVDCFSASQHDVWGTMGLRKSSRIRGSGRLTGRDCIVRKWFLHSDRR